MAMHPPKSMTEIASIQGHAERCWAVAWHPTQPIIASCASDKSVRLALFSLPNDGQPRVIFREQSSTALPLSHTRTVRSLAWNPQGTILASASFDSTVGIWQHAENEDEEETDYLSWECTSSLEGHENEVKAVAWSADGTFLATCGRDKSVWVWEASDVESDAPDFECVAVTMDHTQDVKHVTWHSTQHVLASASYDDTARIYQPDIATDDWDTTHVLPPLSSHTHQLANPQQTLPFPRSGHSSTVWCSAFSPITINEGNLLATCSEDASIRIWQRSFIPLEQLPDRKTVYRIGVAEKERWTCVGEFKDSDVLERAIYSIDWSDFDKDKDEATDLGSIAAGGSDGTLTIFKVKTNSDTTSDHKIQLSLSTKREFAHGISDINCVRWCTSKPKRKQKQRLMSEDENESEIPEDKSNLSNGHTESKWADRWARATAGVLATAGDDGLVKIWQIDP